MQHVILGNGPTGVIAAEIIRKNAPNDAIVLVGDEPEPPYSRMAIPYMLMGNIPEAGTYLRKTPGHFDAQRITLRTGRVAAVDAAARTLRFADGSALAFDRLLLATGSSPMSPPIPGADLPGVYHCWTMADARKIIEAAQPGARVLQMGAGFIGCIIMEALASRGITLSVVEMGDRMVPRMMGEGAGGMIKRWVESKGITVHTSSRVEAITQSGKALSVRLSGGTTVEVDLVISATGVKPNVDFLKGSGITCDHGVITDEYLQTSVPGVYAAGDCAEALDLPSGKHVVSAVQPNAADQAYCAALNMAGKKTALHGVTQINVLDTLGLISSSFGEWNGVPGGDHVEMTDNDNFRYLRLEFSDDVLVGANSIGLTDHVGVLRGLIQARVKLGAWKEKLLADPLSLPEAYLACAQDQSAWGVRR